ncbi:hypothetical protein G6F63_016370 [Rhizopus arrhizus]|nr:hypothetical protein G6F63_016370 [Rhizopus arrhizus]
MGAGRPRHRAAVRMGDRRLPARRPAARGVDGWAHAARRHPCAVSRTPEPAGQDRRVRGLPVAALRPASAHAGRARRRVVKAGRLRSRRWPCWPTCPPAHHPRRSRSGPAW